MLNFDRRLVISKHGETRTKFLSPFGDEKQAQNPELNLYGWQIFLERKGA